jgi:RNA-directed DNA polymerase
MIPEMSKQSDSCIPEPQAAMPAGGNAACGIATAAKGARASRCGGGDSANSGRSDGELTSLPVAGEGKPTAAQREETDGAGSVAVTGPDTAVKGHEQEETTSYRNMEAAKHAVTQQTKCQQGQAPDGRDAVRSIGTRPSVDSLDPTHRATSPARNEEIEPGLSGRRSAATGAGDPPHDRVQAGSPTKPRPLRNGGDTQTADISSTVELTQQSASKPSKQDVQAANWLAVNWPELEARVFRIQRAIHEAFKQGKHEKGHRLQKRLLRSHEARLLAVRKTTEDSKGADTAGVDGLYSLTDAAKWRLALLIRFDMKPTPLRRTFIPKDNKDELRPLGIPTIRDRAIQHLVKLALEPAAETLLAPEQFGFRPGRGCWDAASHIRLRLRKPTPALDADITKFFDRINHDAILRVIPGPPCLINAVRRMLKAGILEGVVLTQPETGTPQGGPISPLLANLVLADLAASISREFPKGRVMNGEKIARPPYCPSYADDFLVIHESAAVLTAVRAFVEQWLALRGLELHPDKTATRHTATMADGYRGFRFLGFGFRHHRIGRHQAKGREWFLWIGPSQESLHRVYQKCVEIIDASKRSRKRNGAIKDKALKGQATPEEIMVIKLNNLIRGWCGYHRPFFAKETFSKLDHMLFAKLWKWALRKHPSRKRAWVIQRLFNNANPWRFTVTSTRTGKPLPLRSAAATPIVRHYPVKPEKSWYDGDWAYWAKRTGHYPMLTARAGAAIKRHSGKCPLCKVQLTSEARVVLATFPHERHSRTCVIHRQCADALRNVTTESAFVGSVAIVARYRGTCTPGLRSQPCREARLVPPELDVPGGASENNLLTGVASAAPGEIFFT